VVIGYPLLLIIPSFLFLQSLPKRKPTFRIVKSIGKYRQSSNTRRVSCDSDVKHSLALNKKYLNALQAKNQLFPIKRRSIKNSVKRILLSVPDPESPVVKGDSCSAPIWGPEFIPPHPHPCPHPNQRPVKLPTVPEILLILNCCYCLAWSVYHLHL
jgi:hypothetical protein